MRLPAHFSNLRVVLILQVALPVLVLLAIILGVALGVIGHFTEERLQRNLQILAQAVSVPVSEALERGDSEQLENSLSSVFDMSEVYGAYLFDRDGRQLVSLGTVNPSRSQADEALRQTEGGEFAQYERIDGRNVYSYFLPLFDRSGQPNGLLQVTRRRSDIENELSQLQLWSWAGFGLLSLLVLGTIIKTHQRSIGQPLERLLISMRTVESGVRKHRAEIDGPQEVKQLAIGLNGMLNAIEQAEARAALQRTERESMAEKLRQTETLAALGQLSAGVAHELGAPLSVVDGRARRLQRRLTSDQDQSELADIRAQAGRMTSIIQQLLSYGRRSRAEQRTLSVTALTQRALALIQSEEAAGQVLLIPGPETSITGDSLSLEQALVNLMRNGLQASPGGQVRLSWSLAASTQTPDQEQIILYVEDDGPGVQEDQHGQLFEPFYTTKPPGEGSGLGLAIVSRVMREHNGVVRLGESTLGGARFELIMPTVAAAPKTARTPKEAPLNG